MMKGKVIGGVAAAVIAVALVVTLSVTLTRNGDGSPSPITASPASQESGNTATTGTRGTSALSEAAAPAPDPGTESSTTPTPVEAPPKVAKAPKAATPVPTAAPQALSPKATIPTPAPGPVETPMVAPEPAIVELAPAPAPAEIVANGTAAGGLFGYFHWAGAQCPDVGGPGYATTVGTPGGNPFFAVKDEMKEYYAGPGSHVPVVGNKIQLNYKKVVNGDTYCMPAAGKKILVGGTILFKDGADGACSLPPTKAGGDACCSMKIWQPNNEGFYENECSVEVPIGGDGTWWLYTELPGDETNGGYADDQAHLHYDVQCQACGTAPFETLNTERGVGWWNKWWQEKLCEAPECGKTGAQHLSIDMSVQEGVKTFKYHTVIVYE